MMHERDRLATLYWVIHGVWERVTRMPRARVEDEDIASLWEALSETGEKLKRVNEDIRREEIFIRQLMSWPQEDKDEQRAI